MATLPWTNIYPDGPGTAAAGGTTDNAPTTNPQYPGMPVGAAPVHKDQTYLAATVGTVLWQPSAGNRFVLASCMISTDTAMRVAVVDGADIPGSRPVDGNFAANGGVSKNQVPVPYPSRSVGNPLIVVVAAAPGAGGVKVSVDGWEVPG